MKLDRASFVFNNSKLIDMEELKRIEQKVDNLMLALQIYQKSILTVSEASVYTGFSISFLYKLIHFNKIQYHKPSGRKVFFKRTELDAFLLDGAVDTSVKHEHEIAKRISKSNRHNVNIR